MWNSLSQFHHDYLNGSMLCFCFTIVIFRACLQPGFFTNRGGTKKIAHFPIEIFVSKCLSGDALLNAHLLNAEVADRSVWSYSVVWCVVAIESELSQHSRLSRQTLLQFPSAVSLSTISSISGCPSHWRPM